MVKVDYTMENMLKCICTVQKSNSDCARERTKKIQEMEKKGMDTISLLEPEDFPWLYCAIGKAECDDLNFEEEYICKDCDVWKEYGLEDNDIIEFYCRDGKAKH